MSRDNDAKSNYSLFADEERVIDQAGEMVAKLEEVAEGVRVLADAYRKQYREQQRMVRLSDRIQLELHSANQRLEEQAQELKSLNKALTKEIEQRQVLEDELRLLATTDPLTGLLTRRQFFELGKRESARKARNGCQLCLVLIDLDHFKKINDKFGHAAGDEALKAFGQLCREKLRETDVTARIGGEEFAVLLPDTGLSKAVEIAERLRQAVGQCELTCQGHCFRMTASMGVTVFSDQGDTLDQAFSRADKALYQAKAAGRDQTLTWNADMGLPGDD